MKYQHYFFRTLGKIWQNLSSAAVVIGALRVNAAGYNSCVRGVKGIKLEIHNFFLAKNYEYICIFLSINLNICFGYSKEPSR